MSEDADRILAERVKQACFKAARDGFEDAQMSGLCAEGCVEAALSAIEMVDVDRLVVSNPDEGGSR